MSITNKESMRFLKVVGCFFILVILTKFYFKYDYTLADWIGFVLLLTPFIAMITWFWEQKISHQRIESRFGSIFFTKKNILTNLKSIELYLADGGSNQPGVASSQSLSIAMKVDGRKANVGIFTKVPWSKLSGDEIVTEVKEISKVTGVSTINTSEQFDTMYQTLFNKEFSLS